jgi:hypothetical protein
MHHLVPATGVTEVAKCSEARLPRCATTALLRIVAEGEERRAPLSHNFVASDNHADALALAE